MKKIDLTKLALMGIASGAILVSQSAHAGPYSQSNSGSQTSGMHGCGSSAGSSNGNGNNGSHCGAKGHCANKSGGNGDNGSCSGKSGCSSNGNANDSNGGSGSCGGKSGCGNSSHSNAQQNRDQNSNFIKPSYPKGYDNGSNTAYIPRSKPSHGTQTNHGNAKKEHTTQSDSWFNKSQPKNNKKYR